MVQQFYFLYERYVDYVDIFCYIYIPQNFIPHTSYAIRLEKESKTEKI